MSTPALLTLEDFTVGQTIVSAPCTVTREEILAFAQAYDPQPFHLEEVAAASSLLGGLAASGWHSCAIGMRLVYDSFIARTASLGAPGIDEVRWQAPVRPGDRLTLEGRITAVRPSRSRPDRGILGCHFTLTNQDGVCVMTQSNSIMVRRRDAGVAA